MMTAILIGILSGLIIIFSFAFLKQFDKKLIYALVLSGIGFLYVGFVWADTESLVINSLQAIAFVFLAYYGIQKNVTILAAGYLLHGCWDIAYGFFRDPGMIPPHYDLFCSSLDFTICIYIIIFRAWFSTKKVIA
jgi:hypothetical protein